MTPFVARCLLVGAAVLLVGLGVVVPLSGESRGTVIAAGAGCAVLDALVVRGVRRGSADEQVEAVLPVARLLPPDDPSVSAPAGASVSWPGGRGGVVLGTTTEGGRPVVVSVVDGNADTTDGSSDGGGLALVVIGTGALAEAVFLAVAAQLRDLAEDPGISTSTSTSTGDANEIRSALGPDLDTASDLGTALVTDRGAALATDIDTDIDIDTDTDIDIDTGAGAGTIADVRIASAPELCASIALDDEPCPPLPPGTAVVAVTGTSQQSSPCGPVPDRHRRTVVLVPGLSSLPRRWDVAIEVGRTGCAVRRPDDHRATPVLPVLPRIGSRS